MKLHDNGVQENDDELAMTPSQFDAYQDPMYELDKGRAKAATRLKSTFEHIFRKYERDFTDTGDEIDLETGEIIINNGHLESMRDENEDGFRPDGDDDDDDESVSSADGRRAKGASDGIGKKASNPWDDPFGAGHTLSSLTMAPSPFGAPPPFSLDAEFPSAQPADPTWRAPDIPSSLFRDNLGFRSQFMGHPGSLEYNSFGQVRIRSSFRDVFGYQAPRKFMTAKSLAKKASNAPSSGETESTAMEDEDILLRQPTPPPAPAPVPRLVTKPPSLTGSHPDAIAATSKADKSASELEGVVNKETKKRGRPKKSTNGTLAHESTPSGREVVPARKVKSAPAREILDTPQDLAGQSHESGSSAHGNSPADVLTSHTEEAERIEPGHRRSARERKQTDFYGRMATPSKNQKKKKVAAPGTNPAGSDVEKVGEHAPGALQESVGRLPVPTVAEQLENEDIASHEDQVEEGPTNGLDAIPDVEVPEAAKLSMDRNELQRTSERLPFDRQGPAEEKQNTALSVPDTAVDEVASREVTVLQPTEVVPSDELDRPHSSLGKDDRDTAGVFDGTTGSGVDLELDTTSLVLSVKRTTEQDRATTTIDAFEPYHSPEPQEATQAESPILASNPTPAEETKPEVATPKSAAEAPKPPSTTRVLRPRKSPNTASGNLSEDDDSNGTPMTSDSHDAEAGSPTPTTATPKQRRSRDTLVVVLPPPPKARHAPSPRTNAPIEQAAQPDELPPAGPPTQEKSDKAAKVRKRPVPTPMTPRRSRSPHDTGAGASSGGIRMGRGRGSATAAAGATPSSTTPPSSSSSSSVLAARYPHLSKSARRIALFSSLVPDDEDDADEPTMSVLTPTSIPASSPRAWTPSFSSPSASRSRSRLTSGGRTRLMSMTPRRPGVGVGVRLFGPSGAADPRSTPTGPRQRVLGGAPSSPLVPRTTMTPSRRAEKKTDAVSGGSPTMKGRAGVSKERDDRDDDWEGEGQGVLTTPGGTARKCGDDGVVCERAFCFVCCR